MATHGVPKGTVFVQARKDNDVPKNKTERHSEKELEVSSRKAVLNENSKTGNSL